MKIGENLFILRKEKGYTLQEVADLVGSSKAYIWEIEKDRTSPSLDIVFRIAEALNTSIEYLIDIKMKDTTATERQLLRLFRKLTCIEKSKILKMVEILVN